MPLILVNFFRTAKEGVELILFFTFRLYLFGVKLKKNLFSSSE